MRILGIAVAGLGLAAGSLGAQGMDSTKATAGGGVQVAGWTGRVDPQAAKAGRNLSEDKVVAMGGGFHVTAGPNSCNGAARSRSWRPTSGPRRSIDLLESGEHREREL